MYLQTESQHARRVRTTNATDNGFPSRIPTGTKPSGTGGAAAQASASAVIEFGPGITQNSLMLIPFGAGSNDNTFSLRVIGWTLVDEGNSEEFIWVPVVLCELAVTLSSTPVGLANKVVNGSQLFADTITVTTGNANVSTEAVSPTGNVVAHAVVDVKGFELVEVTFTTGGSATSCNALVKKQ